MTRRITRFNQLALSDWAVVDVTENMIEQSKLAQAILGTVTSIDGFACIPTTPASLNVELSSITLLAYEDIDATAFGDVPSQVAVNTNKILKLAYLQNPSLENDFVPPATPGFSRNDLIQVAFSEEDDTPESIPFYNPANPASPIFQTLDTLRSDNVLITIKAGVEAATGTQATPTPDAGTVGAWVITTTNGDTEINGGDIAQYVSSPTVFLTEKLQDKISLATGDARYELKTGNFNFKAVLSAPQSIPVSLSDTLVEFDTIEFNVGSAFDTGTHRFQPDEAGYYAIASGVGYDSLDADKGFDILIYKNGAAVYRNGDTTPIASDDYVAVTGQIHLNGTTDYVEIWTVHTDVAPKDLIDNQGVTYVTGWRVG